MKKKITPLCITTRQKLVVSPKTDYKFICNNEDQQCMTFHYPYLLTPKYIQKPLKKKKIKSFGRRWAQSERHEKKNKLNSDCSSW